MELYTKFIAFTLLAATAMSCSESYTVKVGDNEFPLVRNKNRRLWDLNGQVKSKTGHDIFTAIIDAESFQSISPNLPKSKNPATYSFCFNSKAPYTLTVFGNADNDADNKRMRKCWDIVTGNFANDKIWTFGEPLSEDQQNANVFPPPDGPFVSLDTFWTQTNGSFLGSLSTTIKLFTWSCSQCTYSNPASASDCEICANPRVPALTVPSDLTEDIPSQPPLGLGRPSGEVEPSWECPWCTYSNRWALQECEMGCGYRVPTVDRRRRLEASAKRAGATSIRYGLH